MYDEYGSYEWWDATDYNDPGTAVADGGGEGDTGWLPDQMDNQDGSWTDLGTGEVFDGQGNFLGNYDELYPQGSDLGSDPAQPAVSDWFQFDAASGTYYDTLTGLYFDQAGNAIAPLFDDPNSTLQPRDGGDLGPDYSPPVDVTVSNGPGFWAGVGDFFSNLFSPGTPNRGNQGGGGSGGGMSSSLGQQAQQAQQRQQQAAQQLARAAATPGTTAAQLQALQMQYLLASQAANATRGTGTNWGTIAAVGAGLVGVGLLAYAFARRKYIRTPSP